jgi:hypothetical protein
MVHECHGWPRRVPDPVVLTRWPFTPEFLPNWEASGARRPPGQGAWDDIEVHVMSREARLAFRSDPETKEVLTASMCIPGAEGFFVYNSRSDGYVVQVQR